MISLIFAVGKYRLKHANDTPPASHSRRGIIARHPFPADAGPTITSVLPTPANRQLSKI
jgi:hypothetical protein